MFIKLLEGMLTFLNPDKAYDLVNKSYLKAIKLLEIDNTTRLKIRYIFHSCCMIERLIQNEILSYNDVERLIRENIIMYKRIKFALTDIEENFGITIPDTEIGYIIDLLGTQ